MMLRKPFGVSLVRLAVIWSACDGLATAAEIEVANRGAESAGEVTKTTEWPTAAMRKLPPDYLERLRAALDVGTERLSRLSLETSESKDSIGWIRYGLPALLLGRRVDEINRFFESDTFIFTSNKKFGFSLFGVSYMRLYGLLNDRTGTISGLLTKKAQDRFEEEMWKVAKANGKLAEAKRDVWDSEGSENHHLASKTCDLLAAQFLRKIPKFADQKYDDGSTLEEQYQSRRAYFLAWLDERAKRGQFTEAASPSYQGDSIATLFNLYDFAEDPVLRKKTEMYLDLTYAVIAEETLRTTRGGPKSRVKVGHEYDGGVADRGYDVLFNAPGRTYVPLNDARTTSSYYPPPAVVKLAQDVSSRGTYGFATRWPGPVVPGKEKRNENDPDGILWLSLDKERTVLRKGFATPNYVLGSVANDVTVEDDASSGYRWQGAVFASDILARIGFEVAPASAKNWHGFNPFFTVQDRNLFITQCWAPVPLNPATVHPAQLRVYFSPTLDEVQERDGWIFARDGEAYAAVKVVDGGYQWSPAWKHADELTEENKAFIRLEKEETPVIFYVADAADYGNDFAKFQAALKAQPIEHSGGVLQFATIEFRGATNDGRIAGKPINLAPQRGYDSPFVRSEWNSGQFFIRKGAETLTLDFRDPQNPQKAVGGPVTPDFPPGVGSVQPLVFGR